MFILPKMTALIERESILKPREINFGNILYFLADKVKLNQKN
jgi:hypothetical protein